MTTAVLMPAGITDDWRAKALHYVTAWYRRHFSNLEIAVGESPDPWSKGAAIADALERSGPSAQVLVLADADSFIHNPDDLAEAISLVERGKCPWVIPHEHVYRLKESETARLHDDPTSRPRLGHTCRPVYIGPAGGGITVVARDAYDTVHGIDARFVGWGGEDVAFGWALETLVAPPERLTGHLVHLWHPHPAPNLRGSAESEHLVARYQEARGVPRRMTAVVAGEEWSPLPPLEVPVRFRMIANRSTLRLSSGAVIRFRQRIYETTDQDEIEQIRRHRTVREERRR